MLFSLFINNLCHDLNSSGLGIDLGPINISSIFFADDIVLISRTQKGIQTLMNLTRTFFKNHKLGISEKKSKVINYNASTDKITFHGASTSPITLDQVLSYKYLGVPISCAPYNMFKDFNDQVKKRAKCYLASILSLVKSGPDRAELAYVLWTCCGLPSILYGTEVMPLTQSTISEVEKCQSQVGKFILQLPRSSASVSANIDAGLKPVWAVIADRVLVYASTTMRKPASYWPRIALNDNLGRGYASPYTRYLLKWKEETDHPSLLSIKPIKKAVTRAAIARVLLDQKHHNKSTFAMNTPEYCTKARWFKPKGWVTDSCRTRVISVFRACNASLGNRMPTKDGRFFALCPLCSSKGIDALNNEVICTPDNMSFKILYILGPHAD